MRSGASLLDVHPEPVQPTVEVMLGGEGAAYRGVIDTSGLIANIHAARAALASLVDGGWFEPQRSAVFDFISHFSSVDEWLRHREERRSTSVIDPSVIAHARELLPLQGDSELRVSERVLASSFRRGHASQVPRHLAG